LGRKSKRQKKGIVAKKEGPGILQPTTDPDSLVPEA